MGDRLAILAAMSHLVRLVEQLDKKVDTLIKSMEWEIEYETSDESDASTQSAPATFLQDDNEWERWESGSN